MAEDTNGTVTVTRYIPVTGISSRDIESYDDAMFSAMSDLMGKFGYSLVMKTETNIKKGEAWIQLVAKKKE